MALLVTNAVYIDEAGFIVLMLLKIICAIAYMGFACMMQELFMGGDKLAKGEYGHKVNTRFMFGKFKEHNFIFRYNLWFGKRCYHPIRVVALSISLAPLYPASTNYQIS